MGFFDIFTNKNAQDAANAQIAGLQKGYGLASSAIGQGSDYLRQYFGNALQPYQQNYNTATQGTTALGNALGLNGGPAGAQAAASAYASNPAFQFMLDQGSQNVLRNSAATGTTASGATLNALQNQGMGLANQTYQQYIQNLMPYLGYSQNAAGGIAGVNTGLGSALNANQGSLANLGWQYATGQGNAQANADLAKNQAGANMWNAVTGGIGALAGIFSDERLKEDISPVGELYDGTNVYRYRYKWDDPGMTRIGVMAQEVEKTNPDAVTEVGGYKAVDYGKATRDSAGLARFMQAA